MNKNRKFKALCFGIKVLKPTVAQYNAVYVAANLNAGKTVVLKSAKLFASEIWVLQWHDAKATKPGWKLGYHVGDAGIHPATHLQTMIWFKPIRQ